MENLRELNIRLTKESLKEQTGRDILIIQTIHTIDELISTYSFLNKLFFIQKNDFLHMINRFLL